MLEFLAAIERHLLTIRRLLAGSTSITDEQLRATPIDVNMVSGSVTIGSELEITNDSGNPIPVDIISISGDIATETTLSTLLKPADTLNKVTTVDTITNVVHIDDNSGSITVDGPLTDTELRATPVPISGTITITPSGTQDVNIVSTIAVPVTDNGGSLTVDGTVAATQSGSWVLGANSGVDIGDVTINNAAGAAAVNIQDGGNSITVDGTITANLGTIAGVSTAIKQDDIISRLDDVKAILFTIDADTGDINTNTNVTSNKDFATETTLSTLNAKLVSGTDIGDVTINNAGAGAAVNIQDGGNSITVDGTVTVVATDLDIRNLTHTVDTIMIGDGTDYLAIDGSGRIEVTNTFLDASLSTLATQATLATVETNTDYGTVTGGGTEAGSLRVTIANDSTGVLSIDDNGGSITVDGTITANAGTDLNTSALALEATLQSVKTAVEIIDNAIAGSEMQVDVLTLPTIPPDLSSITYDAGARQRVSQLTTLGDYKILNADRTLLINTVGDGTGTFTNNTYTMSVTGNQYLVRQSKNYHHYFSGKSQIVELTFENFHAQANVKKRIGYFSSDAVAPYASNYDGIFLENDGTDVRFRISRNGTTILNVKQSDWNTNVLLGHDWSLFNVVLIDFLWLGGAVVRLFVKTATGFELCHVYSHAATAAGTMTLSPNQPIRYEIRGDSATGTMTYICAQVSTEGSINESGLLYGITHGSTGITLAAIGTTYPILAVRKKSTHRDIALELINYKLLTTSSNDQIKLWLLLNPTTSSALTYSSGTGSVEYAIGNGTITINDLGTVLNVGFSTQISLMETQDLQDNFLSWLGCTLNNTMDTIVLAGTPITTTIVTHSSLTVKEY